MIKNIKILITNRLITARLITDRLITPLFLTTIFTLLWFILWFIPWFIPLFAYAEAGRRLDSTRREQSICPKTKMSESCLICHAVPSFRLKEGRPDAHLVLPDGMKILDYPNNPKGYFLIKDIDQYLSQQIFNGFEYLKRHKIKYVVLDIHSSGGSLFDAWRIKSFIDEFILDGGIVETQLRGMALSAGAIVFVAGSRGYRIANAQSEFMLHELGIYKGGLFYIEKVTPSSAEEEANILRHLQKTITDWFATRGKLTAKQLEERIKMKEFWLSGREAFELGFVDKLIGEKISEQTKSKKER